MWFDSRLLTLNVTKTKFVPFATSTVSLPTLRPLKIEINNSILEIPPTNKIKYLGLHIDPHLKWDMHINHVVKRIRCLLSKFKYLARFMDKKNLITAYYALVESQLRYGIIAWGGAYDNHIKKLEIVQKWMLKIILKKEYTYPTELLFQLAEVLDIRQLYSAAIINHLKTNKQKETVQHRHDTRHKAKTSLVIPKPQKTLMKRSFLFIGPHLYNKLPLDLKVINSTKLFKNRLKKWLLNIPKIRLLDI